MAISKTVFTGTSKSTQAPEVLTWMQANATNFFDSITANENGDITCTYDGTAALVLGFYYNSADVGAATRDATLRLANGTTLATQASNLIWDYGVATSTGIILVSRGASNDIKTYLYVTKTDKGNTAIFITCNTTDNYGHFHGGDIKNSLNWADYFGRYDDIMTVVPVWSSSASLTTLTPVCINGYPAYTPNLYYMRFSEYPGIAGKLSINGSDYYSTGYLALKE